MTANIFSFQFLNFYNGTVKIRIGWKFTVVNQMPVENSNLSKPIKETLVLAVKIGAFLFEDVHVAS